MNDDEYLTFLYDRAARRDGYPSHAAMVAETDTAVAKRRERERTANEADMQAWAEAQMH